MRKIVLIGDGEHECDLHYADLLELGHPNTPEEPDEHDAVVLMYTGGTTGLPKGALLDQRAEMLNLYHIAMTVDLAPGRVYLHQIPMFHAASMGGILGIPAIGGVSVFQPLFEPEAVMALTELYKVDWTTVVPTMIAMILNHPNFRPERFASMRDLVYGASPMPHALLDRLQDVLPHVALWQGYGMTECSSVLTMLTNTDHRVGGARLHSAGRPVLGVQLSVHDRGGNELPPHEEGEVCARAGNFFSEYWHRPKETETALHGGWYHTGDIGHLDEEGFLYLVDRSNDMIVSGGENVYSIEVENALSTHPAVAEVAVIGVPHDTWGEQVHAVVVLHPGAAATTEDLQEHARKTIAGYKVPKTIEFRSEPMPLSGALKPLEARPAPGIPRSLGLRRYDRLTPAQVAQAEAAAPDPLAPDPLTIASCRLVCSCSAFTWSGRNASQTQSQCMATHWPGTGASMNRPASDRQGTVSTRAAPSSNDDPVQDSGRPLTTSVSPATSSTSPQRIRHFSSTRSGSGTRPPFSSPTHG